MSTFNTVVRVALLTGWCAALLGRFDTGAAQGGTPSTNRGMILEAEGTVEFSPRDSGRWYVAATNQVLFAGDRLRTMERSRATVYIPRFGPIRLGAMGFLEMPADSRSRFNLLRGIIYFFHRGKPADGYIQVPNGATLIRGTEFTLSVGEDGAGQANTTLTLFDGEVDMTNSLGSVLLRSGEQGFIEAAQAPRKTAVIYAGNATQRGALVQWALYYPAVLDVDELNMDADTQELLRESLAAYRTGDLKQALQKYPAGREPKTDQENVFLAALLLSVGEIKEAERRLAQPPAGDTPNRVAAAASLRKMIDAVQFRIPDRITSPKLASDWLAESYARPSRSDLGGALDAARNAAARSPSFGFAWERVAELEFSFGRVAEAKKALENARTLSPRHAQAVALEGFLLAAENKIPAAMASFDEAIALDGGLGNAWLGRGLCRIHQGDLAAGLIDLEMASALEPNRAVLRSYLAKALDDTGDRRHAEKELAIAKGLDPLDPTAWLYSAHLNERDNRINEAIRDLEKSQALNPQRGIYRSQLLLDQDNAVRKANLARIYQDAGLVDVSTWEAARAVNLDYANYSAHLFLANSYDALRDPQQVDLRYETPWLNEYLLANLLAPVGAGILSPTITQQEYSRLFERDRVGFASATEYSSRGDWSQFAAQFGAFHQSAYSLEEGYRVENGDARNAELEQLSVSLTLKHEITARDRLYGQVIYYDAESGDVAQHFDPRTTNPTLRAKESQIPLALLGYTREWGPGSHTLLLATRLEDTLHVSNARDDGLILDGDFNELIPALFLQRYRSDLEIYGIEAQHILQRNDHTFILGSRFQAGPIDVENLESRPRAAVDVPPFSTAQEESYDFERFNAYLYDQWRVAKPLLLVAGVAYDHLTYPENFRFAPVGQGEKTREQVSPKGGLLWTPLSNTTFRAAYSRSLGGMSFDQSFQLEPSQVAGINQAFRSLIPESSAGSVAAEQFETAGFSLEQMFGRGTYAGLSGEWLESDAARAIGLYEFAPLLNISSARQALDYRERSLGISLYQLIGHEWSTGVRYRFSVADLESRFPGLPPAPGFNPRQDLESSLHQVKLFAIYSHSSGFFGQVDALWMAQNNDGYGTVADDDFYQLNAYAGYRFLRRRVEARVGVLNINDADYRLSPLNLVGYLPRERTFVTSMRFSF